MTTTSALLSAIADKLEPEGAWTQGAYARNTKGHSVPPEGPLAVCWCWRGAAEAVGGWWNAEKALAAHIDSPVIPWNDNPSRTQSEVVRVTREVAAKVKEGEETGARALVKGVQP